MNHNVLIIIFIVNMVFVYSQVYWQLLWDEISFKKNKRTKNYFHCLERLIHLLTKDWGWGIWNYLKKNGKKIAIRCDKCCFISLQIIHFYTNTKYLSVPDRYLYQKWKKSQMVKKSWYCRVFFKKMLDFNCFKNLNFQFIHN